MQPTKLLTQNEIAQAKLFADGEWSVLSHEDDIGLTVYMRREGNKIHFMEVQANLETIIADNKKRANEWNGWAGKEHGAVVSAIPINIYNDMVRECGYDGNEYDQKRFDKMLNDPDYKHLRTGGGSL